MDIRYINHNLIVVGLVHGRRLYAQHTGRSSRSGGGTSSTATVPASGDSTSVSVNVSTSGTTAIIAKPTATTLNKVIGSSVKTGEIIIDVSGLKKDITTVSISTETIKAIEQAVEDTSNNASALTAKLTDGSVTFDAAALASIAGQAKGNDTRLNLNGISEIRLSSTQRDAIKGTNVQAAYGIYLTSDGTRISGFDGGKATMTVNYTLRNGQV